MVCIKNVIFNFVLVCEIIINLRFSLENDMVTSTEIIIAKQISCCLYPWKSLIFCNTFRWSNLRFILVMLMQLKAYKCYFWSFLSNEWNISPRWPTASDTDILEYSFYSNILLKFANFMIMHSSEITYIDK